ncbi:hypothetical protein V2J09_019112 [Rumex salicifolius]
MGSSYRVCFCFMRKFRAAEAEVPADVKDLFSKYAGGGSHMSLEQLRRFLQEEQSESDAVVEEVMRRRHHHHHHFAKFTRSNLTVDEFFQFLFSVDLNGPINPQVHQDMNGPLSHYFIYTGHNSYLTGNQLSSDCSDVPIIRALKRGVRVIELDLWPNSTKDDVHVLHGRTLTTPVELMKCLKSIKEHAFSSSPYPVILTLEDHLTPDLQVKVAQMITETFKDFLFYLESGYLKDLPSPEDLKYRIILSTKPPKEYLATDESITKEEDPSNEKVGLLESEDNLLNGEDSDDHVASSKPPVYKRLISIPTVPRHRLREALKGDPEKVTRISLSEETLEKSAASYGTEVIRYTGRNILRIFPKTTRFNSSNYKPLIGWIHGAQMVAFNMQGHGKYLWWMQGLFRANGGCGYVKKPDFLNNFGPDDKIFDPKAKMPVKVYMGDGWSLDFKKTHFDTYSPPDFYTKIGIAGVPADETTKKTKVKEDQWNPVWEEEFTFELTIPELALLRVEVHEYDVSEKDDFAGQTCLPVWEIKPGMRAVPLYDHKGERYNSVKLLMRFEFV